MARLCMMERWNRTSPYPCPARAVSPDNHDVPPESNSDAATASDADRVLELAQNLAPDDRLWLIVRLWLSLPVDHWAAPTDRERAELGGQLRHLAMLPKLRRRVIWVAGRRGPAPVAVARVPRNV